MKPKSFTITNSNNSKSSLTSQHGKTTTATTTNSRNRRRASARSSKQNHDIWMQAFRYSCRWLCKMCDWFWRWIGGLVLSPWLYSKWTRFEDDVFEANWIVRNWPAVGFLELSLSCLYKILLCYVIIFIQSLMYGHQMDMKSTSKIFSSFTFLGEYFCRDYVGQLFKYDHDNVLCT